MGDDRDDAETTEGRPPMTAEDELAISLSRGRDELGSGRAEAAADLLEDAVYQARQLEDEVSEAQAQGLLAQAYLRLDLRDEAARVTKEALAIATVRGDEEAITQLEQLLVTAKSSPEELEMNTAFGDGRAALVESDVQRAAEHLERALELARRVGHPIAEGASLQLLAQAYLGLDRKAEAAQLADEAEAVAVKMGDQGAVEHARELKARATAPETETDPLMAGLAKELTWGHEALAAGDLDRGVRHLERARDQAVEQGESVPEASALGLLAQAYIELDRFDEAGAAARRALEVAEALGHQEAARDFRTLVAMAAAGPEASTLVSEIQLAATALEAGDVQGAVERLEQALAAAEEQGQDSAKTMIAGLLARAYQQLGRREEAVTLTKEALARLERAGEARGAAHFRELLAELESGPN